MTRVGPLARLHNPRGAFGAFPSPAVDPSGNAPGSISVLNVSTPKDR